ncbi:Polygalacturonate 4-alpha-galacturonosyltransferase, partial [Sesamum angolense]
MELEALRPLILGAPPLLLPSCNLTNKIDQLSPGDLSFTSRTGFSQIFPGANLSDFNQQTNPAGSPDMNLQAVDDLLSYSRFSIQLSSYGLDHVHQPYQIPLHSSNKMSSDGAAEAKRSSCSKLMEAKALQTAPKKSRVEARASCPPFKVRKEKVGDRIAALQQLVAPFGKTDTASVLMEAIGYIKFLQTQVEEMATERGLFCGVPRNNAIGSLFTIAFLIFFSSFLAFSFLFIGRVLLTPLPLVIDVSKVSTEDFGPPNVKVLKKNNLSASWKFVGKETTADNVNSSESTGVVSYAKQETSKAKQAQHNEDHSSFLEKPSKLPRRQLRGKRRENHTVDLVKQDYDVTVKLENEPIQRSKSVDSAVLGKYSLWRKQNENENSDSNVRTIQDQMIMARVYISLAITKNKLDLVHELQNRLRDSQRSLGEATTDAHLHRSAPEMMKAMDLVLSKARERLYSCKLVTEKLRAMLQSADEQVRTLKKQSTFLSQLAAKTIPNGLHCLSMRLTIDYYLLPPKNRKFPRSENLENPNLYHYALFSDNVLAASVVVNSTIMNAKLESAAMKEYYFKAAEGSSNLKYRNPKYLSMLNHLRFYLPQVYPKLDKILFLDDDIVVQKDLTGLWAVNLNGNVNGAVETCGESFHRFDKYLNFSNPHIAQNFDPNACGWAYGMNIFDLKVWKKKDITGIYHKWQNMNEDRVLWKLGTLPPGLMTFYGLTHPLQKSWHVLGLGYNPSVNQSEIQTAAVIHYNGNMKPCLPWQRMAKPVTSFERLIDWSRDSAKPMPHSPAITAFVLIMEVDLFIACVRMVILKSSI